jgi:hypothetical protein
MLQARVLFDFHAPNAESMSLVKGDVVDVITRGPPGGWSMGVRGAFPTDYVEFFTKSSTTSMGSSMPPVIKSSSASDPFSGLENLTMMSSSTTPSSNISGGNSSGGTSALSYGTGNSINNSTALNMNNSGSKSIATSDKSSAQSSTVSTGGTTPQNSSSNASNMPISSLANTATKSVTTSTPLSNTSSLPLQQQPLDQSATKSAAISIQSPTGNPSSSLQLQQQPVDRSATVTFQSNTILDVQQSVISRTSAPLNQFSNRGVEETKFEQKPARKSVYANRGVAIVPLTNSYYAVTRPGATEPSPIWRQHLFLDLFADYYASRMINPEENRKIPAITRFKNALSICRTAIAYINPDSMSAAISSTGYFANNVLGDISAAIAESIELCENVPLNTNDATKIHAYLMLFMARVRGLEKGGILLFPVAWMSQSQTSCDHGILLLLHRTRDDNHSEEYSLTIINTYPDEGLSYHSMCGDKSDASVKFNIAFVLKNIPNIKVYNTAFW